MILLLIINVIIGALNFVTSFLPSVDSLPLGLDSAFVTAFGWLQSLLYYLWPLQVIFDCIVFYISFKIFMMLLKFFLGNRTPIHT